MNELKNFFKNSNSLNRLIIVNAAVFILLQLVFLALHLFKIDKSINDTIIEYIAVPADLKILLFRPWTILTYMFLHEELLHILINMLWLWWLGQIFYEYLGSKKLVSTYILGGIAGGLLYILCYNIFPVFKTVLPNSYTLGASAGILAIVIATATLLPDYKISLLFIGSIPLKYIAVFSIVLDLIGIRIDNPGGHIAHLGGALFGFIYVRQLRQGRDIAGWFNIFTDVLKSFFQRGSKVKVVYNRRKTEEDYLDQKKRKQEVIDVILDKIAKSGYESLTKEEKEVLFKASKG